MKQDREIILRCVSWEAVSSSKQAAEDKNSTEVQREKNIQEIEQIIEGVVVACLRVEESRRKNAKTGETYHSLEQAARHIDAYASLEQMIQEKSFDVLVCFESSRLGRSASLQFNVTMLCMDAGILVYPLNAAPSIGDFRRSRARGFQRKDYGQMYMHAMAAVNSQMQVEIHGERQWEGTKNRIENGMFPGKPIYGYRKISEENKGHWVQYEQVPSRMRVVRRIYDEYMTGSRFREIAARLNNDGIHNPSGNEWKWGSVQRIIDHVWGYAGWLSYNSARSETGVLWAKGRWEPILTEADARTVEQIRSGRHGVRKGTGEHRFAKVLYCGGCGNTMYAGTHGEKDAKTRKEKFYYYCPAGCRGQKCWESQMLKDFETALERIMEITDISLLIDDEDEERLKEQIDQAEKEIGKQKKNRQRLLKDRYEKGIEMTEEEFRAILNSINKRMDATQKDLIRLQSEQAQNEDIDAKRKRLEDVRERNMSLLTEEPRAVNNFLQTVFAAVVRDGAMVEAKWF